LQQQNAHCKLSNLQYKNNGSKFLKSPPQCPIFAEVNNHGLKPIRAEVRIGKPMRLSRTSGCCKFIEFPLQAQEETVYQALTRSQYSLLLALNGGKKKK